MTLTSTTVRESFSGNDSTTAFSYTFRCYATSEIVVFLVVDSTGVGTVQTETTHYSVSLDSDYNGGTVTMVTAPATGETLWLISNTSTSQNTDLITSGAIPAETVEARLDRIYLRMNQMQEEIDRCLKIPRNESSTVLLPNVVDRVSETVQFDASGDVTTA